MNLKDLEKEKELLKSALKQLKNDINSLDGIVLSKQLSLEEYKKVLEEDFKDVLVAIDQIDKLLR